MRHIYVAVATKETNTRRAAWSSVEVLSGSLLLSFGALVATFFTFGGDIHYTAIFILLFANVFTPLVFYVWRYLCTPDASKERLNEYQARVLELGTPSTEPLGPDPGRISLRCRGVSSSRYQSTSTSSSIGSTNSVGRTALDH